MWKSPNSFNFSRDIPTHMNNTLPIEYDSPKKRKVRPANIGVWVTLVAIPLFLLLFGLLGGFNR